MRIALVATVTALTLAALGLVWMYAPAPQTNLGQVEQRLPLLKKNAATSIPVDETYRNRQFHFSVQYPAAISPVEKQESGTLTVIFQGASGEEGFQVYAAPFPKKAITDDQFLRDVPSGVRNELRSITISSTPATAFYSTDAQIGDTFEVWFIHGGVLYEVTTYKEFENDLMQILSTWSFVE